MKASRHSSSTLTEPAQPRRTNTRRHGRIACERLACAWGEIVDLSASGLRVLHRGGLRVGVGQVLELRLETLQVAQVVKARIVRIQKAGFRKRSIALEFVEITPEAAAGICAIARLAGDSLTVGHPDHAPQRR